MRIKIRNNKLNDEWVLMLMDKEDFVIDGEMLVWQLDYGLELEDITKK